MGATLARGPAGFTLVEALFALTLASLLVALATTMFVAQSRFFRDLTNRGALQDRVRSVAELIRTDLTALTAGAVTTAAPDRMIIRTPVAVGVACGSSSSNRYVYLPLGGAPLAEVDKSGVAVRWVNGWWLHFPYAWSTIYGGSAEATTLTRCASAGADTSGAKTDFMRLVITDAQGGNLFFPGFAVMLYAAIELRFDASTLQPGRRALFRGLTPDLLEFATGFTSASRFEYRVNGTYLSTVSGTTLYEIDAIRVVIEATDETSSQVYSWTIEVPFRNMPTEPF
jgi:hypothetical protein